jgi:2-oxoglutarate ferredoxin oxidoreductase subunit alpha
MNRDEHSVLVGGQAGDGVMQAGNIAARLFNRLGYWVFVYADYPSLIRGGHNFAIVRASARRVLAHNDQVDILVALNQDTFEKHKWRLKEDSTVIFDQSKVKAEGLGLPLGEIVKNRNLPAVVRNVGALGALACLFDVSFATVEDVVRATVSRSIEENVAVAKEAYDLTEKSRGDHPVIGLGSAPRPLLSGNEALGLGAVSAGMKLYVAYPMTPTSNILHYLSEKADSLNITVIQPENEIAAIGMAEGAAYAGVRAMVGTSGGGFDLMVEHLSLAGQAEIPVVAVLGQRPGPSTGVPTHTAQGDLLYAIFSGHGEFPKVVISPGDAEEALRLSRDAMNLAWRFQVPVILLTDKHLCESIYSVVLEDDEPHIEGGDIWGGQGQYKRYLSTDNGVSPLAFPGTEGATIKSVSYEHDEYGITTESPDLIAKDHEKRLRKEKTIEEELRKRETVRTYGSDDSKGLIVTWGSTKGAAVEVGERYGLKVVQPLYLNPLPVWALNDHLRTATKVVSVETNSGAGLATWLRYHGFKVDQSILKYDGRPFTTDELEKRVREVFK